MIDYCSSSAIGLVKLMQWMGRIVEDRGPSPGIEGLSAILNPIVKSWFKANVMAMQLTQPLPMSGNGFLFQGKFIVACGGFLRCGRHKGLFVADYTSLRERLNFYSLRYAADCYLVPAGGLFSIKARAESRSAVIKTKVEGGVPNIPPSIVRQFLQYESHCK